MIELPGSPYLDERPHGLLTWPLLMPILLAVFLIECLVGFWIWTTYPSWKIVVYVILGIDLVVLVAFYVLTTKTKGEDLE